MTALEAREPRRWLGLGKSSREDAVRAGAEAARDSIGNRAAKLLIVFCADSYDLDRLLVGIRQEAGMWADARGTT